MAEWGIVDDRSKKEKGAALTRVGRGDVSDVKMIDRIILIYGGPDERVILGVNGEVDNYVVGMRGMVGGGAGLL
ncbi:hypothetical protein BGS_0516 [Beggiatoa sp. SS]|nr:hypothetical protein BGS_0516 [Beggiatoa sp. SS]